MAISWQSKFVKSWQNFNESDVENTLVPEFKYLLSEKSILVLQGDLGAGKTAFVKAFLHSFLEDDKSTSPTYNLVNEYKNTKGESVFHMDLYRLESEEELYDLGIEDILNKSYKYIIVEWADVLIPQLQSFYHFEIEKAGNARHYTLHKVFVPLQG